MPACEAVVEVCGSDRGAIARHTTSVTWLVEGGMSGGAGVHIQCCLVCLCTICVDASQAVGCDPILAHGGLEPWRRAAGGACLECGCCNNKPLRCGQMLHAALATQTSSRLLQLAHACNQQSLWPDLLLAAETAV